MYVCMYACNTMRARWKAGKRNMRAGQDTRRFQAPGAQKGTIRLHIIKYTHTYVYIICMYCSAVTAKSMGRGGGKGGSAREGP